MSILYTERMDVPEKSRNSTVVVGKDVAEGREGVEIQVH